MRAEKQSHQSEEKYADLVARLISQADPRQIAYHVVGMAADEQYDLLVKLDDDLFLQTVGKGFGFDVELRAIIIALVESDPGKLMASRSAETYSSLFHIIDVRESISSELISHLIDINADDAIMKLLRSDGVPVADISRAASRLSIDDRIQVLSAYESPAHLARSMLQAEEPRVVFMSRMVLAESSDEILSILRSARVQSRRLGGSCFILRLIVCALRHENLERLLFETCYKYACMHDGSSDFGVAPFLLLHKDCPTDLVLRHRRKLLRKAKPEFMRQQIENNKRIKSNREVLLNLRALISLIFKNGIPSEIERLLSGDSTQALGCLELDVASADRLGTLFGVTHYFTAGYPCLRNWSPGFQLNLSKFSLIKNFTDDLDGVLQDNNEHPRFIPVAEVSSDRALPVQAYNMLAGFESASIEWRVLEFWPFNSGEEFIVDEAALWKEIDKYPEVSSGRSLIGYFLGLFRIPFSFIMVPRSGKMGFDDVRIFARIDNNYGFSKIIYSESSGFLAAWTSASGDWS